jgi:hypothetical protein
MDKIKLIKIDQKFYSTKLDHLPEVISNNKNFIYISS